MTTVLLISDQTEFFRYLIEILAFEGFETLVATYADDGFCHEIK
jgi:hypothetical protein